MPSFIFLLSSFLLSSSSHAVTGLSTISGSACSYQNGTNIVSLPNGSTCDITSDGNCRRIGNGYGATLMVPGREGSGNFAQFFSSPPGGVSVASCCTPITCYQDADGDGYGNPGVTTGGCGSCPGGYVANNSDCCDANGNVRPGAGFFTTAIPAGCGAKSGTFDYDCSGAADKQYTVNYYIVGSTTNSDGSFESGSCYVGTIIANPTQLASSVACGATLGRQCTANCGVCSPNTRVPCAGGTLTCGYGWTYATNPVLTQGCR